MTKESGSAMFRYLIDVWFDRPGILFNTSTRTKKEKTITMLELERLELIRKLEEERKVKNFSRTESAIEELSLRAL